MKELTKKEIIDLMRCAGSYMRDVYHLFDIDIMEVTKYKCCLVVTIHGIFSESIYEELYSLFCDNFAEYKDFIDNDGCYHNNLNHGQLAAHFEVKFYA